MSKSKPLLDEYGIIYEAMRILPDDLKIDFIEALAELEDNECHRTRTLIFGQVKEGALWRFPRSYEI